LVGTCLRGNDFATTKTFGKKNCSENFWKGPVSEKMILRP